MAFKPEMRFFRLCILIVTIAATIESVEVNTSQRDADMAQILNCVQTIASKNNLGFLTIKANTSAFPLATGPNKASKNDLQPVIAGGRIGQGRVVATAHDEFFHPDTRANNISDRATFLENVFQWVSSGNQLTVHVLIHPTSFQGWGNKDQLLKIFNEKFSTATISSEMPIDNKAKVIVVHGELDGNMVPKLKKYVQDGGGLIVLANNWWFSSQFKDQEDFSRNWSVNQLVGDAGFEYQYSKSWNFVGELFAVSQFTVARPKSEYRCEKQKPRIALPEEVVMPSMLSCDEA